MGVYMTKNVWKEVKEKINGALKGNMIEWRDIWKTKVGTWMEW